MTLAFEFSGDIHALAVGSVSSSTLDDHPSKSDESGKDSEDAANNRRERHRHVEDEVLHDLLQVHSAGRWDRPAARGHSPYATRERSCPRLIRTHPDNSWSVQFDPGLATVCVERMHDLGCPGRPADITGSRGGQRSS